MKLICVGTGSCRCLVLRFRKANILLDCATPLDAALCAIGNIAQHNKVDYAAYSSNNGYGSAVNDQPLPIKDTADAGTARTSAAASESVIPDDDSFMDLTPFLPILQTLELHAALISSAEALLALPHLVQCSYDNNDNNDYDSHHRNHNRHNHNRDSIRCGGKPESGTRHDNNGSAHNQPTGALSGLSSIHDGIDLGQSPSRPPPAWHHIGPIKGPIYCTQAVLDAAELMVAERRAAEEAAAAGGRDEGGGRRTTGGAAAGGNPGKPQTEAAAAGGGGGGADKGLGTSAANQGRLLQTGQSRAADQPHEPTTSAAAAVAVAAGSLESQERQEAREESLQGGHLGQQRSGSRQPPQTVGAVSWPGSKAMGIECTARQEALLASCWRRRPSWRAVRHCLDRVRPVRYSQIVALDGYELTAAAYPSGSGFGHAVWQIRDGTDRCRTVLYLPHAAPSHPVAPPLPLDVLRYPDVLLMGPDMLEAPPPLPIIETTAVAGPTATKGATAATAGGAAAAAAAGGGSSGLSRSATAAAAPSPGHNRRPGPQTVKEAVLNAVVAGGSAILPVYSTGEAWELLELLAGALTSADLPSLPLLYVAPRARPSLALASVSLEALAPGRQAAVYRPEHPFAFDAMLQSGRLVVAPCLEDPAVQRCLQQPAVVLVGADSLTYPNGAARHLLARFRSDPRNVLVLPCTAPPATLSALTHLLHHPHIHLQHFTAPAAAVKAVVEAAAVVQAAAPVAEITKAFLPTGPGEDVITGKSVQQSSASEVVRSSIAPPPPPPPLRMRVVHAPLHDRGPSPSAALELLGRLQPRHLVISDRDLRLLRQQQQLQQQQQQELQLSPHPQPQPQPQPPTPLVPAAGGDGSGGCESLPPLSRESVVTYGWLRQIRVGLVRNVHDVHVRPELLQKLHWMAAGQGLQLARLNCLLVFRGGAWHADPVPGGHLSTDAVAVRTAMAAGGTAASDRLLLASTGRPALTAVLKALAEYGMTRVTVAVEGEVARVSLDGTDAVLVLQDEGAHISTSCPVLRAALTDCITRQLTAL